MRRPFGPIPEGEHLLTLRCPGCNQPFRAGEYGTLIPIGPGDDEKARRRAREGHSYNAVAIPAHWACVTGETDAPLPGSES